MGTTGTFWCAFFFVFLLFKNTETGVPTLTRRLVREIYPEIESDNYGSLREGEVCVLGDVVYAAGEDVPAEQPCLRCKCQPPGVHCETIKCSKKTGCKTIHHPNKCCPDYQCECLHEDKIYANGERMKTSTSGDCKVCYCRGGEIQCTEVSCYVRRDCEGKKIQGQCCLKYDHCPLKETATKATKEVITEKPEGTITESSEDSTELEGGPETQQTPSILKIGDRLLFLKKGDSEVSTPVITIIGAEGLQIGFEESEETGNGTQNSLFNNSNDLEPKVAESTHIFSVVKHKKKPDDKKEEESTTMLIDEKSSNFELSTTTTESFIETSTTEETSTQIFEENKDATTTDSPISSSDRSIESVEDSGEQSGENTTPKDDYSSMSFENISIEANSTDNNESEDMMLPTSIPESEIDKIENQTNSQDFSSFIEEVEMVSLNETSTSKSSGKRKRESSFEDDVFKQLELELNADNTERASTDEESEKIFQELLDETSTPKSLKTDKNSKAVDQITDAISQVVFGGRKGSEGTNILEVLSNLFNFQHRFGKKK